MNKVVINQVLYFLIIVFSEINTEAGFELKFLMGRGKSYIILYDYKFVVEFVNIYFCIIKGLVKNWLKFIVKVGKGEIEKGGGLFYFF